jgi:hypothetical protein
MESTLIFVGRLPLLWVVDSDGEWRIVVLHFDGQCHNIIIILLVQRSRYLLIFLRPWFCPCQDYKCGSTWPIWSTTGTNTFRKSESSLNPICADWRSIWNNLYQNNVSYWTCLILYSWEWSENLLPVYVLYISEINLPDRSVNKIWVH